MFGEDRLSRQLPGGEHFHRSNHANALLLATYTEMHCQASRQPGSQSLRKCPLRVRSVSAFCLSRGAPETVTRRPRYSCYMCV